MATARPPSYGGEALTPDDHDPSPVDPPDGDPVPPQGTKGPAGEDHDATRLTSPPDPPRPAGVAPEASRPHETIVAEVLQRRRTERARDALVSPWSAGRARRLRLIALVLIIVGPVLGSLFALVLIPSGAGDEVAAIPDAPAALAVTATVRNVDATTGEVTVRLVPGQPTTDEATQELFDGGVLAEDVTLGVNDSTGESVRVLPAGQAPGALTLTVPLTDSRVTRYPLDSYQVIVLVQARIGGPDGETVPVDLTVSTNDPLFTTSAEEVLASSSASVVTLRVERRATVIGWAVFFLVLCWMLAIAAASIGWVTVVHGLPAPVWSWAFLIGILFALPPLRASLPGTPPGGSLVDFAAFYWAVGIVAFTLVALAGAWNVRVRRWPGSPDAPRPPP